MHHARHDVCVCNSIHMIASYEGANVYEGRGAGLTRELTSLPAAKQDTLG